MTDPKVTFYAAVGEFIVEWNRAETSLRSLLLALAGRSRTNQILTVELGTTGLTDALKALAREREKEIFDAVDTVIKVFEHIRTHRHYYVHGISLCLRKPETGEAFGLVQSVSAKGRFNVTEDHVDVEMLTKLKDYAVGLQQAVWDIVDTIDPQAGSKAYPSLPTLASLATPGSLKKTFRYSVEVERGAKRSPLPKKG